MIKIPILAVTILLFSTMMVQQVYAPDTDKPEKIVITGNPSGKAIPDWVKSQFEWYVNGQIDEKTLLTSMNWMFNNNIMHLSEKAAQEVQQMREEMQKLKNENQEMRKYVVQYGESDMNFANRMMEDKGMQTKQTPKTDFGTAMKSGEIYTDEYGRIKVQFPFDKANKDEIARLTAELYVETMARTQSSSMVWIPVIEDEVLVSFENGDPDRPIIIGRVYHSDTMPPYKLPDGKVISGMKSTSTPSLGPENMATKTTSDRPTEEVAFYYNKVSFATDTINDIMTKGGTTSAWKDGISAFSKHGMSESVVDDLQGIVVLCNTAIEKKSQAIDAELKMIQEWLKIIEEKQATDAAGTTTDYYGRAQTATGTDYNQSDLDFITRKLSSIDQQIKSLDTGIVVLKEKLASVGDDAQLANIDLQNALQKQQQALQTLSNVSKATHDTAKAVLNNIRS